jgi:hypothetical protein
MKLLDDKIEKMEENSLIYIDYTEAYMNKNIEANLLYFDLKKYNIDFIPVEDNINDFLILKTSSPELMEMIPFFIIQEEKGNMYILKPVELIEEK